MGTLGAWAPIAAMVSDSRGAGLSHGRYIGSFSCWGFILTLAMAGGCV